ncbi:glycosyltransferase family 39 protein [Kitasatospora sp. NBC_01250]|uniref:ArnT family glycosyltransferase n=1 Tax=Kitasatospora sp. NBC_01250 TaxID=2903571 RepID=UPI002E36A610|nr:glycosyltransferase family 39 protein [Kitasatospora sp. NBC_01250]
MATSVLPIAPELNTSSNWPIRRAPWRSPEGQPAYARPALLGIAAVAGLLYFWGIGQSTYHSFYADAVRSMTESWKAFVFGSYDPANTITLDKLPGFLWPQAVSARIFGFHPWALTLPQAIEGVLSVLVLYRAVRRWAGANAALLAAAAFALTPVLAGLFRTAVEDPLFTLLLLLAADAAQRAAATARLRTLLLAGVWVGLSFQAKMLESWAVLPALAAVYLIAAPTRLRRRLAHIGLAGLVTLVVSASWVLLATVTPAQDRPYIDGTTNNSAFSMVVGYNFLNRFTSVGLNAGETGSVTSGQGGIMWGGNTTADTTDPAAGGTHKAGSTRSGGAATGAGAASGAGQQNAGTGQGATAAQGASTAQNAAAGQGTAAGQNAAAGQAPAAGQQGPGGGGHKGGGGPGGSDGGWTKMFGSQFAPQTGWLYPLAAIALLCALAWRRREPRGDTLRAGYVMWGTWLATFFLVFSAGSVGGHSYYMGVIATPLAALSGAGIVLLWQAFKAGGRRAWALPVAVAATAGWAAYLAHLYPTFLPWLTPATLALGVLALALLGLARSTRFGERRLGRLRIATVGLIASLFAMLLAPGAWAASVLDSKYGNSGMGTVGPQAAHGGFGGGAAGGAKGRTPGRGGQGGGAGTAGAWGGGGTAGAWGGGAATGRSGGGRGTQAGGAAGQFPGMAGGGMGGGMGQFGGGGTSLTKAQQQILDYTEAHADGARYLFATTSWSASSPYILATGKEVMPMGGFTGQVPSPSLAQFQQLVSSGQLRYVLLGSTGGFGGRGGSSGPTTAITTWVRSTCAPVAPGDYGQSVSNAGAQLLYLCSR